ncbi:uncharacterized protein LOC120426539 [Culex pipiens pallens]|uniref:uncharacterized protein LOC120426539 n=1 Tax=Culex pipiens pallens TaxID=42434 RepID=UPI001953C4DD|nr:uncharacterized protein LOC120426539 [Culex pipiens pallens]
MVYSAGHSGRRDGKEPVCDRGSGWQQTYSNLILPETCRRTHGSSHVFSVSYSESVVSYSGKHQSVGDPRLASHPGFDQLVESNTTKMLPRPPQKNTNIQAGSCGQGKSRR